jgi:hypothetical protein
MSATGRCATASATAWKASALGEAVALFERAHREDTLECPQSICVTQDLAACYGNIDGPGWVPERIEVCDETLGRIDPELGLFPVPELREGRCAAR